MTERKMIVLFHCDNCDGSTLTKEAWERHRCGDHRMPKI